MTRRLLERRQRELRSRRGSRASIRGPGKLGGVATAILGTLALGVAALVLRAPADGNADLRAGEVPRAVLVDQLALEYDSPEFRETVVGLLTNTGYRTEVVPAREATVESLRSLPSRDADVIILRSHAALVIDGTSRPEDVALFTNERVDLNRYTITGLRGRAEPRRSPFLRLDGPRTDLTSEEVAALVPVRRLTGDDLRPYYGIGHDFVREHLAGRLKPGSVVVLMGCDTLRGTRLSEAFMSRGAGAVIGWSDPVSAVHADEAASQFVRALAQGASIDGALAGVMGTVGPDPDTGARLIAAVQ